MELDTSHFEFKKQIGKGRFGVVHLAIHIPS